MLTDLQKVQQGRLLHRQSKGHHGRAKAVLKVTAAEWPAGTDDYTVVLDRTPRSLNAYSAETQGNKLSLPLKTPVSELKAADKTVWIEGTKDSDELRDVRLSLALDRRSGGMSKAQKADADWARFTVVNIASVKLEYTAPPANQPVPWNASKKRWYINYQAGDAGRTVTIRATLSKRIAGIKLHFMLSPDKKNLTEDNWGVDLPGTWNWDAIAADIKQKDKAAATDLLHKSEDTDVEGKADCDLVLSRIGGDVFRPAAYITQDPHLAAYVHGHDTLEKRKPKICKTAIKVWRKFAYQKIQVATRSYPATKPSRKVYDRVRAEMHKVPSKKFSKAEVDAMAKPSLLPEYMFKVGGSTRKLRLNVSDANQGQFFVGAGVVAPGGEHPILVPLVTCDYNWGLERNSAVVAGLIDIAAADFPKSVPTDVHACDPPLQGGTLLATGDWVARDWNAVTNAWENVRNGALAPGDIDIDPDRDHLNKVRITLPAAANATAQTHVTINNFTVRGAPDHYLGGYNIDGNQHIVCVYDPADPGDYQNTIVHELGHAFYQTGNALWAGAQWDERPVAVGVPSNPSFSSTNTGPHCVYNVDKCVMFTSGPIAGSLNRYCPNCHPQLLAHDMSSIS